MSTSSSSQRLPIPHAAASSLPACRTGCFSTARRRVRVLAAIPFSPPIPSPSSRARARGPKFIVRVRLQPDHGDVLTQVGHVLRPHRRDALEGLPPFQGGAAGYLAYDWGRVLERLPESRYDDLGLPDAVLGIYDWVIAWDHRSSRAWLISTGMPETDETARSRRAEERAAQVMARLRSTRRPVGRSLVEAVVGAHALKRCQSRAHPRIPSKADGGIVRSTSDPPSPTRATSTR